MSKRNWPGITLQTLAWIVLALAVSLPYWLHLDAVGARYPFVRTWGLFDVHGKTRRSHAEVSQIACEAKSQLTTLQSNCTYGICEWYAAKCNAYPMIALSSYIVRNLSTGPTHPEGVCEARRPTHLAKDPHTPHTRTHTHQTHGS